jgi:chitin synthase
LKWIYLSFLCLQFVLALGNRPKGERIPYVATLWVYGFLSIYLVVCSIWLTVKAFADIPRQLAGKTSGEIALAFIKPPIGALIAAMISTFGIYFTASFLYRDPWHMFSSFLQYLALAPSFTNVLNVYAFCNLHDVSWGTKGSDKADPLPSVSSSKGKDAEQAVVEDKAAAQDDVDAAFKETVTRAITRIETKEVPEKPTMDDSNKTFRTRLVAVWMLSNVTLAVLIGTSSSVPNSDLNVDEERLMRKQNTYFGIILYSTFGLSLVRFLGCLYYFVKRNLFRWFRRN